MAEIHHAGISVSELGRAVAWYTAHFGFKEEKRFEKAELEIRGALLRLGDGALEILEPYAPSVPPAPSEAGAAGALRRIGANHLSIAVDDPAECMARMMAEGCGVVSGLIDGRFFFCKDPDGTLIEVRRRA